MDAVAEYLDLPPIQVYEVATFYSMFETAARRPASHLGVHEHLLHAVRRRGLLEHVEKRLGIKVGESTPDGRFFLKQEEECLAACTARR